MEWPTYRSAQDSSDDVTILATLCASRHCECLAAVVKRDAGGARVGSGGEATQLTRGSRQQVSLEPLAGLQGAETHVRTIGTARTLRATGQASQRQRLSWVRAGQVAEDARKAHMCSFKAEPPPTPQVACGSEAEESQYRVQGHAAVLLVAVPWRRRWPALALRRVRRRTRRATATAAAGQCWSWTKRQWRTMRRTQE